ncbi:MAG TPA: hypothetical protein VFN11_20745, partial [Ktedonobacterales bacterium]|nr:hypothetical protein [Ktedonobacterales bacterium]
LVTQGRTVYLPHKASEVLLRVARTVHRGDELQVEDQQWMDNLAREIYNNRSLTNVTLDYFDHLLVGAASMDKPIMHVSHAGAEQDKTLADILPAKGPPDPSDTLDLEALLLEMVNRGTLSRRDGWLIVRHFGLDGEGGRTYIEMAREMAAAATKAGTPTKAVSRQRIEQLISAAMRKVRQYVGQSTWQLATEGVQYKEQRKGSQVPLSPAKVKSTESPKRSTRNTSVNDLSQETVASRAATPTPLLRVHDNTKRATGSSRGTRKSSGLDVQYPEAI